MFPIFPLYFFFYMCPMNLLYISAFTCALWIFSIILLLLVPYKFSLNFCLKLHDPYEFSLYFHFYMFPINFLYNSAFTCSLYIFACFLYMFLVIYDFTYFLYMYLFSLFSLHIFKIYFCFFLNTFFLFIPYFFFTISLILLYMFIFT